MSWPRGMPLAASHNRAVPSVLAVSIRAPSEPKNITPTAPLCAGVQVAHESLPTFWADLFLVVNGGITDLLTLVVRHGRIDRSALAIG